MFGFFTSPAFSDPRLGELRRSRGRWRGTINVGDLTVPLAIAGSRTAPDPEALDLARRLEATLHAGRQDLAHALFEHYSPYAEAAVAADPEDAPASRLAPITRPDEVWPHATPAFVSVTSMSGTWTIEIGYTVPWDEEHTLGARFQHGRFAGLNGSVLAP